MAPHKDLLNQLKKYEINLQENINMTRINTERQTVHYDNLTVRTNIVNPIGERMKTNQSHVSKVSHVSKEKTVQQSKLYADQLLPEDFEDMKSMRSYKSNNSRYV